MGKKRGDELDGARREAGKKARLPSDPFRVGHPLSHGDLLCREHHQEDVGDEARRIDPVRECADVVATLAARQLQS